MSQVVDSEFTRSNFLGLRQATQHSLQMKKIKTFIKKIVKSVGFQLVKIHPRDTLETIQIVLANYLEVNEDPVLIQVGACDGKSHDPIFDFLVAGRFTAILIEPLPENFKGLEETYGGTKNISLVNAAITDETSSKTIYYVKNEGRWRDSDWAKQWASFDKKLITKHGVKNEEIAELEVPTTTVPKLVEEHQLDKVDVLVVDTEGFDDVVLNSTLESNCIPDCIFFEFVHIPTDRLNSLCKLLKAKGYTWAFGRSNALCLHENYRSKWISK